METIFLLFFFLIDVVTIIMLDYFLEWLILSRMVDAYHLMFSIHFVIKIIINFSGKRIHQLSVILSSWKLILVNWYFKTKFQICRNSIRSDAVFHKYSLEVLIDLLVDTVKMFHLIGQWQHAWVLMAQPMIKPNFLAHACVMFSSIQQTLEDIHFQDLCKPEHLELREKVSFRVPFLKIPWTPCGFSQFFFCKNTNWLQSSRDKSRIFVRDSKIFTQIKLIKSLLFDLDHVAQANSFHVYLKETSGE